ncbi:MAG: hypothetical protein P1V18_04520 [Candidatus Gracilibacteria bacterium]|nr:hypothetical protein [Candidatus Gracilibacteria bacterium]
MRNRENELKKTTGVLVFTLVVLLIFVLSCGALSATIEEYKHIEKKENSMKNQEPK